MEGLDDIPKGSLDTLASNVLSSVTSLRAQLMGTGKLLEANIDRGTAAIQEGLKEVDVTVGGTDTGNSQMNTAGDETETGSTSVANNVNKASLGLLTVEVKNASNKSFKEKTKSAAIRCGAETAVNPVPTLTTSDSEDEVASSGEINISGTVTPNPDDEVHSLSGRDELGSIIHNGLHDLSEHISDKTDFSQVLHSGLDGIQDALVSARNPVVNLPASFGTSCKSKNVIDYS